MIQRHRPYLKTTLFEDDAVGGNIVLQTLADGSTNLQIVTVNTVTVQFGNLKSWPAISDPVPEHSLNEALYMGC